MDCRHTILLIGIIINGVTTNESLRNCTESEINHVTTSCSEGGKYYIITVPKDPSACQIPAVSFSMLLRDCNKICTPGYYYDNDIRACKICSPGSASPGNVFKVSSWSTLPPGFFADNNSLCNNTGWYPKGSYLHGNSTSNCPIKLTFKNTNQEVGILSFEYKFRNLNALAQFTVLNERCSVSIPTVTLHESHTGRWRAYKTKIAAGETSLHWYISGDSYSSKKSTPLEFMLKDLIIVGRSAATECPVCGPGYHSTKEGSQECTICPINTFSQRKASVCEACPDDKYSFPGASDCVPKLQCKASEYMAAYTTCSKEGKTHLEGSLISPAICKENHNRPIWSEENVEVDCLPCPLGSKILNESTCEACPSGYISSDQTYQHECLQCPLHEVPIFGIHINSWNRMPPFIETFCDNDYDEFCPVWRLNGSSIFAGPGLGFTASASLVLRLRNGFLTAFEPNTRIRDTCFPTLPGTRLEFEFEMICGDQCELKLLMETDIFIQTIKTWYGNHRRQTFSFDIQDSEGVAFLWYFDTFSVIDEQWKAETRNDRALIYSIAVNNTRGTGALGCKKCPLGTNDQFCEPCEHGSFFAMVKNETTNETNPACTPCPSGYIAVADASSIMSVDQACQKCPPGTKPGNGSFCVSDLQPTSPTGQAYNFSEIVGKMEVIGTRLFTTQGTVLRHRYKFNLDTSHKIFRPLCSSDDDDEEFVYSYVCRESFESATKDENDLSNMKTFRPLSLGDKLVKALPTNSSAEHAAEINAKLTKAGWKADEVGNDFHYYFEAKATSSGCPDGRSAIVTLRCDMKNIYENFTRIRLPPNCADGTCDGCLFQFMVLSPAACPICQLRDYYLIEGSCINGEREIHRFPNSTCVSPPDIPMIYKKPCSVFSTKGKIAVGLVVAVVVVLLLAIFYFYQRTRKIEYKYMKLIEGAEIRIKENSNSPEFANGNHRGGTGCGIPDEDHELVLHDSVSPLSRQLNKLRSPKDDLEKSEGLGPVIFRSSRVAEDSHILTLDEGNVTETV